MGKKFTFYEFFAGGGMARAGLGEGWQCLFANDFDRKKAKVYTTNWGDEEFVCDDIRNLEPSDMSGQPDLVWGSFPCQDLSLAGGGAGLRGDRSGTFWPFIAHMRELRELGRAPKIIALENVLGTLTSHKGADFQSICQTLRELGYRFGAIVVDAALFLPQSRPRLFVIGIEKSVPVQKFHAIPNRTWHSTGVMRAYDALPPEIAEDWIWWSMPDPAPRDSDFIDIIEENPESVVWHTDTETNALLSMMSEVNISKVELAKQASVPMVGGVYKRTRYEHGIKVQRAEVRFDRVAGCLRTPAGGSSRQLILKVDGKRVKSRLISARETARLMGLPDSFKLPTAYNEAYHLTGDGVAVPVVRYLAEFIFEPILQLQKAQQSDTIAA